MGKRRFSVSFSGSVVIDLDDAVIEAVDDEWRSQFYTLKTPEEIAEHIVFNMVANKWPLSYLDGWADQPDENAELVEPPEWGTFKAEEIAGESTS
jgi:hypothetical protein